MTKQDVKNVVEEVIEEVVEPRFKTIDQQFKKIDQRFEKIDQRFEKIDQRFEKIDQRFIEQDKKMEKLFKEQVSNIAGLIEEKFIHYFNILKESSDTKDEKTNRRIDLLETEKVDRNWSLLLDHDRLIHKT